jgi:hypothetical protein
MAIKTFQDRFGTLATNMAAANGEPAKTDKPKTKFWLDVGYQQNDEKYPFVSLLNGIPLDTMADADTKVNNREFAALRKRMNVLRDTLLARAERLEPGETVIISNGDGGLDIRLRHHAEREEFVADEGESFAPPISFAA